MSTFVRVLEASPSAYVKNENGFEVRLLSKNIVQQLCQAGTVRQIKAAPSFIAIRADDAKTVKVSVCPYRRSLILE